MAEDLIMNALLYALFTIIGLFQQIVYTVIFWVYTPFLKTLTFSLLMINLIQYFDVNHAKVGKVLSQVFYGLYCLISFLLPYYEEQFQLEWWEWILLVPFLLVAFVGTFLKFTMFGRRFLNYFAMHLYYTVIAVFACIFIPVLGVWWGCLLFSMICLVLSNIGGLWKDDATL